MSMTSINDPDRLASSSSSIRPALAPTAQSPKGDTSSFYRRHQPDRRAPFDAHDLMHRQHTNRLAKWRSTRPTTAGSHIRFIKFLFVCFVFFSFLKKKFLVIDLILSLYHSFCLSSCKIVDLFLLNLCSFHDLFPLDLSTRKVNFNRLPFKLALDR